MFTNGENHRGKTPRVNLRSLLQRIHYYQLEAVTSVKNLTKPFGLSWNTNLQLNPYSNTQLDLYCSGNLSIQCTNPSSSVHQQWRSGSSLVTKPLATLKNPLLSIRSGYKYEESYQTLWPILKYQPTVKLLLQYPIRLIL